MGFVGDPLRSAIAGVIVKVAMEFYLTSIPSLNVKGAGISTVAGSLVAVILNLIQLERRLGFKVGYARAFLKPVASSAVMGLIVWLAHAQIASAMGGSRLAALVSVTIGGLIYAFAILVSGGMSTEELEAIPLVGKRAARLAAKLRYKRRAF
jgi:stage V sporulation protein B